MSEVNKHEGQKQCDHCHGEGHIDCKDCNGTGKETCPTCKGEHPYTTCTKCNGSGKLDSCHRCDGSGLVDCYYCDGIGKIREECPTCNGSGSTRKRRTVNCGECHGTGIDSYNSNGSPHSCRRCAGRGQVDEYYEGTCSQCGGSGKCNFEVTCPECKGEKKVKCQTCGGTGHEPCRECDGEGKIACDTCKGTGEVACHTCHGSQGSVCVDCFGTGYLPPEGTAIKQTGKTKWEAGNDKRKQKNYAQAFELYRESAVEGKNANAVRSLGWWYYEKGLAEVGIIKNEKRANELYSIAANIGNANALWYLGRNYLKGVGVEKNLPEARRLLELAKLKGCEKAAEDFKEVESVTCHSKDAVSGVVGWLKEFKLPKFVMDEDPVGFVKKAKAAKAEQEAAWAAERERTRESYQDHGTFVVLGMLLGSLGIHLLYARRWFLWLVHLVVTGVAAMTWVPQFATRFNAAGASFTEFMADHGLTVSVAGIATTIAVLWWIATTMVISRDGTNHVMVDHRDYTTNRKKYIIVG